MATRKQRREIRAEVLNELSDYINLLKNRLKSNNPKVLEDGFDGALKIIGQKIQSLSEKGKSEGTKC